MQNQHKVQMQILRELLFNPWTRFTDLNIEGLTSDHFTYHIKTLVQKGYIKCLSGKYLLTASGKEFANTMDTDRLKVEKQAKVGVLVIAFRREKDKSYILIQTRLKEPYFGFRGFITGKVRFGETVSEAASRELFEETGLGVNFVHRCIVHEHVYSKQNDKLLEDKFFHVFQAIDLEGKLIDTTAGKNEWIREADFPDVTPKFYDEDDLLRWCKRPQRRFVEKKYYVETF